MSDFVHIRLLCFDGVVCGMEERELLFACEMVDQDGAIPLDPFLAEGRDVFLISGNAQGKGVREWTKSKKLNAEAQRRGGRI